jgi:hypothetical protein
VICQPSEIAVERAVSVLALSAFDASQNSLDDPEIQRLCVAL